MRETIERLLNDYERGKLARRDFLSFVSALVMTQSGEAPISVRTLNHVTLFVSNVDRSKEFYRKLLGLPIVSRQENGLNLGAGSSSFIGLYSASANNAQPHINHFCIGVNRFDAEKVKKQLSNFGVAGTIRVRGEVKELYFKDPDNLTVQLQDVAYRG